ncbi:MAG: transcriptional repressor [bacterium]|nr:transcriptional repressor [bacterium]
MVQEKALRETKIRRAMATFLAETAAPLSAADLKRRLRQKGLEANKTTLYRALERFLQEGTAIQIDLGDNVRRYESAGQRHHHHAVCLSCSKVSDVELSEGALSFSERKLKKKGFETASHSLEFFGLCVDCRV